MKTSKEAWRVAAMTSRATTVDTTSTSARQILVREEAVVMIESVATVVNAVTFILVLTVKHFTVIVTPTLVRTAERAS